MSGCTPLAATPSKTCVCRSMSPGVTVLLGISMTRRASDFGMFAATRAIFPSSTAMSSTPRRSCPGSMTLPPFKSKSYMVSLLRRSEPDRDAADHVVGVEIGLEVQPALIPQLEVRKEGIAVLGEQREVAEELEGEAAADEPAQDERRLVRVDGDGPRRTEADVGLEPPLGISSLVINGQRSMSCGEKPALGRSNDGRWTFPEDELEIGWLKIFPETLTVESTFCDGTGSEK